eukprot:TRINITY_DN5689_c0_g1_i1.p2 TRINITY_DN5689_c0_g1~~TRINITY_DN5689_c0_g1_i1.p2  ORF type:complete len:293 (+),score=82.51 TRINITY_DN5689_c0_g1_i1:174-1052(+)
MPRCADDAFPQRAFVQVFTDAALPVDYAGLVPELRRRGIETVLMQSEEMMARGWGALGLTRRDLVVGDFDWTRTALAALAVAMPVPPDYPACLKGMLHREIWPSTLGEVVEACKGRAPDGAAQTFVKPAEDTKAFSAIIEPRDQMAATLLMGIPGVIEALPAAMPVHCAELVTIVSEARVYVAEGEIRAVCEYKPADPEEHPAAPPLDTAVVRDALARLRASGDPADGDLVTGCGMDFMVMQRRGGEAGEARYRTALVEVNDGYSLGVYDGLDGADHADLLIARWRRLVGAD